MELFSDFNHGKAVSRVPQLRVFQSIVNLQNIFLWMAVEADEDVNARANERRRHREMSLKICTDGQRQNGLFLYRLIYTRTDRLVVRRVSVKGEEEKKNLKKKDTETNLTIKVN